MGVSVFLEISENQRFFTFFNCNCCALSRNLRLLVLCYFSLFISSKTEVKKIFF